MRPQPGTPAVSPYAIAWATVVTVVFALLITLGSRKLAHFDAALVGYTFATLFAVFGITYEKVEQNFGVFWPCPSQDPRTGQPTPDHPGTPRLFEPGSYNPVAKGAGPFYFPDGKARFSVAEYRTPVDDVSTEYPIYLTTGRVVSQFLPGTQIRRIGLLVKQYPEPTVNRPGPEDARYTAREQFREQIRPLEAHR